MAKRKPCSRATGTISLTVALTVSPGITISTPFGKAPNRPFSKPEDSLPKPVKPAITSIDAFEKTKREESEVRLEGNTINLKNNKSNS